MRVKNKVLSIFLMLLIIPIFITLINVKAAPPEGFNFNNVFNLFWTDQEAISQEGEYHLVSDEIDGMPYAIPMLANWLITADMGDVVGAFNSVDAIYPGHDVAYAYYIFMVDIEELHFYNFKMQLKKTVPFDELVSVTTEDPLVGSQTVFFEFKVEGQTYASQVVNKGDQLEAPADPVKEYFIFDGWYKDQQFNYLYDFNEIVVNGFNLYAKFSPGPVTINFYSGDSLYRSKESTYGNIIYDLPIDPHINDYAKEYLMGLSGSEIDYNSEAKIFKTNNIEWETNLTENAFNDYYLQIGSTSSVFYLKEAWEFLITEITITYSRNSSYSSSFEILSSVDGINWTNEKVISFDNEVIKTSVKLKNPAYFIKIKGNKFEYSVKGRFYDIMIKSKVPYNDGKKYVFDKWYYDQELTMPYHEDDVFTADTNLYAGYKEKKFELSFNSNSGSPVTSQFYYEDDEIVLPEYNPSRIGYVFDGWYLDEELEEEFDLDTMPDEDITLYAKWVETEETQFLIEFYLGEDLYTYITLQEEQQLILPTAPPASENKVFFGWFYDEEFTEQFKVTDPIEDDLVLYGKFTASSSGGSGGDGPGDTPGEPTTKPLTKYLIIAGWSAVGIVALYLIFNSRKTKSNRR